MSGDRDDLTGLLPRGAFHRLLESELRRANERQAPLALLMIDLDYLKTYNDHYGHAAGDAALVAAAAVLNGTLRAGDSAGRLGGDEFVAILPGTGLDEGLGVAERLRAAAAETSIPVDGTFSGLRLSMSVGVSCFPDDGQSSVDLLAAADRASYAAKLAGRNAVRTAVDGMAGVDSDQRDLMALSGRMIGRVGELVGMRQQLESAIQGHGGGQIVVEGEAGTGKSRLLAEFANLAGLLGARVLQAGCREGDSSLTCAPFRRALSAVSMRGRDKSGRAGSSSTRRAMAAPGSSEQLLGDDREHMVGAIAGLIERLCIAGAGQPATVVLFDHPRWADVGSLRLVDHLARAAPALPLLIVRAGRPGELDPTVAQAHAAESTGTAVAPEHPAPSTRQHMLSPDQAVRGGRERNAGNGRCVGHRGGWRRDTRVRSHCNTGSIPQRNGGLLLWQHFFRYERSSRDRPSPGKTGCGATANSPPP